MLTSDIRNEFLVDEMQLGTRLNEDLHAQNRADFALMLCMLSNDVIDHPQFNDEVRKDREVNLRAKFHLPEEQRKYAESSDFDRAQALTEMFANEGMVSVHLANCLRAEPLVDFERTYSPEVFSELPPLKQQKLRHEMAGAKLTYEKIKETGDGFDILDEINTGRLMAKIESVA